MYRDHSKRQRRNLAIATFLVVVLIASDYFSGGALRAPVRAAGTAMWGGISGAFTRISGSGFFATRQRLARENEALRDQIVSMQGDIAAARATATRMKELEQAVHRAAEAPGITAPVASSLKVSPYGTFHIGGGASEGVQQGALVLSLEGFAIGRVADTSLHSSLVKEFFASGESIEAIIGDTPLSLSGSGGGNAVGTLPRGTEVAVGAMIFARTDRSHAIGVVGHIEGGPESASLKIYARTPTNLETVSFVYVLQ